MNKKHVKRIAVKMIKDWGLINLSLSSLCEQAGMPEGSFAHVMGCTFTNFISQLESDGYDTVTSVVNKGRVRRDLRRNQILLVAMQVAKEVGYNNMQKKTIAERANISVGLIAQHFGTMIQLQRTIMRTAVHKGIPEIVAQGLANQDPHAKKASPMLKAQALNFIANY